MGRSTSGGSEERDFSVLLMASSFMSTAESKSWTNTNRVRMFGERWQLCVCLKQPDLIVSAI